ncbi:MAG: NAD(P)/FAD-dependent oxidoreductase [bacterium]|nr:NAD(P)/FAD-dependent oxidoreductase [bacterium]
MTRIIGSPYRKHDPAEPFDAIVIGSGMGGLATAALLARHGGKRVLVLEKHYMPGGFTHVFRRKGYEWDVGLHYIGRVQDRRAYTRRLFDHLTDGNLDWAPMDDVYDRIVLGEKTYDMVAGADRFAERMKGYFPAQAAAVDRYMTLIDKATKWSSLYFGEKALSGAAGTVLGPLMRAPHRRWTRRTTREVLEGITDDRELIGVLTGQYGDYGLPPAQSSFAMHAALVRHYMWGGSYPVGGSSEIAATIAPLIEEAGGKILYYADVKELLVRGDHALGVRMADGTELTAPVVISSAGVGNTYLRLLPRSIAERHGLVKRMRRLKPSHAHLCVYAGLRGTADELGLPKHNLWLYPGPDHDANVEAYMRDPEAPLPVVYVSFPSAKDPTFGDRYPGRSTIELITFAPFERFMPWFETDWHERGDGYEALKERLAERLLEALYGQLPHLRGKIDYFEISTPLSTRHFANYERGEIYGVDHTPERFEQKFLRPKTPIHNLYLTGQDVVSCGVAGAMAAGFLTASVILKRNLLKAV